MILEEVMDTPSVNPEVRGLLTQMYSYIEEKSFDKAEAIADYLETISGGRVDGVAKARVLISRGRRYEKNC